MFYGIIIKSLYHEVFHSKLILLARSTNMSQQITLKKHL